VEKDGEAVEVYHYHSAASFRFARRLQTFGRRSRIETANDNAPPRGVGIVNDGADRVVDIIDNSGNGIASRRYTHDDAIDMPLQVETFDDQGLYNERFFIVTACLIIIGSPYDDGTTSIHLDYKTH